MFCRSQTLLRHFLDTAWTGGVPPFCRPTRGHQIRELPTAVLRRQTVWTNGGAAACANRPAEEPRGPFWRRPAVRRPGGRLAPDRQVCRGADASIHPFPKRQTGRFAEASKLCRGKQALQGQAIFAESSKLSGGQQALQQRQASFAESSKLCNSCKACWTLQSLLVSVAKLACLRKACLTLQRLLSSVAKLACLVK